MTAHLHDRLAALAAGVEVPAADVEHLSRRASRRRLGRAALVAVPLVALLVGVPVAVAALGDGEDRLVQQAVTPTEEVAVGKLQATVEARVVGIDGVSVTAAPTTVPLASTPTVTHLNMALSRPTDLRGPRPRLPLAPFAYWREAVRADTGEGVLGMSGGCGGRWEADGSEVAKGCPPPPDPQVWELGPGDWRGEPLYLYRRVGSGEVRPGVYRASVELEDAGVLELVVTVAEQAHVVSELPAQQPTPDATDEVRQVEVYFMAPEVVDCTEVVSVTREIDATDMVATAALQQLFAGPTEEERARGLGGFGPDLGGLLRSVHVEDGTAYVDLDGQYASHVAFGNYGTSCGSSAFFAMTTRTLTQFPTVDDVVFAFDGDPVAFVEFMQGGCEPPVEPGGPCDPEPFRR